MSSEKRANAAVMILNGISIDTWIELFDKIFIDGGWWSVFHQSTEYLIIGTLIIPKIVMIVVILLQNIKLQN